MADEQIRVVISGTAAELRKALQGAKGDLGGLSAAIKAVPDKLKVDVQAETQVAVARLRELQLLAGEIPDEITITADADTGVATAKLALLQAKAAETERTVARAQLGGSFAPPPRGPVAPVGGGGDRGGGGAAALGWGTGIAGFAGAGSALSFAGLGFEHLITTILSLAGSATAAAGGGGLLALGSAGKLAVGGGADAAVMKSTIADTKALSQSLAAVTQAQAVYGAGSRQAAVATAQLNQQMASLGNTAGVKAELGLAKATQALNTFWDAQTSGARVQAVAILMQGVDLAHQFTPLVAQAAQQNLAVINASLKPLFAWLQGPQGVQIFNDLENAFAKTLPTAVHAFTQGLELFLRVTDIASRSTGGFITHLDQLLTRWNSMDNAQLGAVISKLVADFHLWDTFVKLLVTDIYLLFHQDVGTGNSIVQALTGMLERLHAYETSARGSAQIQSIFMVHKTEILALLALIPGLISGFGGVYMALAPPMVAAMTVILQVIKPVLDAIAAIANSSQLAGVAIGGMLIYTKFAGISAAVTALKSLVQWLLGTRDAALAAAAAETKLGDATVGQLAAAVGGGKAGGGVKGAVTGTEKSVAAGAAGGGFAATIRGAFAAAAPAAGSAIAAAFSGWVAGHAIHLVGLGGAPTVTGQARSPGSLNVTGGGVQSNLPGFLGKGENAVFSFLGIGGDPVLKLNSLKDIAGLTSVQVKALTDRLHTLGVTKVDVAGVTLPLGQVLQKLRQQAPAVDAWNRSFSAAWNAVNRDFFKNVSRSLPALVDDFHTALREINSTIGLNSNAGLKLWAQGINKMVQATTLGMLTGKINVTHGLAAINQAIKQGVQSGAITWEQGSTDMFYTLELLYTHHKIKLDQYLRDIRGLQHDAFDHIRSDTQSSQQKMYAYLLDQENKGNISHGEFLSKWHQAQADANTQQSVDMAVWVATLETAMKNSGALTAQGMKVIAGNLNNALGLFGAAKLPIPDAIAWGNFAMQGAANTAQPGRGHRATGGLVQIGRPGEKGHDTIGLSVGGQNIAVGAGEQIAVFNHDQQQVMNQRLADMGGLPGMFARHNRPHYMAHGGYVPFTTGGIGSTTSGGGQAPAPGSGWQNVIASAESLGGTGYRGNPIQADGYSELSIPPSSLNFSALGNLPYQTHMRIRSGSREVVAAKQDVGAGSSFLPVMGLYPGTVSELGLSGGEFHVSIERADGVPLTLSFGGGGAGGGVSIPTLTAPGVGGKGALADIVRGALKLDTAAANKFLQAHAPAPSPAGGGGGGGLGVSGPKGLGSFDGYQVADWIIPILNWARGHGWGGHITSGFRPGGASEHAGTQYPGGAIDVGDSAAVAQGTALYDVLKGYPGQPNLLWGGIYISGYTGPGGHDYGHFSGTGHARGGLLDGFAAGGTTHATRYKAPPKIKAPKPHKPTKLPKLPRLKSLAGFDQTLLNQINTMSSVTLADLSTHEGYLQGLHGLIPFEALVTLADGSQVVNEDGMIDPSTGQWVKGISQRLAEIGAPGNRDISTELGVQDTMLADLIQEQAWAGKASGEFGPWAKSMGSRVKLDAAQKAWLSAAVDPSTPYRKLPPVNFSSLGVTAPPGVHVHGGPAQIQIPFKTLGSELRRRAKEYKDLLAQKLWATKLKEQLPLEKQKRDAALTARFAAARHQVQISGLTSSFDGSQLLAHQKELLGKERRDTLAGIKSAPPASWLGDTSAWHLEHARELASINDEFDARATALSDAAAKHKLTGQISRSNALFGISQTEAADKLAVGQQFGHRTNALTDLIRADTSTTGSDKRWLSGLLSQVTRTQTADTASLKAGTDPGGFGDTLKTYLDPLGQLSTDILTKHNIDIPALMIEIGQLKGTTAPVSAGGLADTSAMNALLLQQLPNAQTDLAVSQSQFSTLAGFQPLLQARLLGSFQSGTGFVPQTGPYVLHKGEQVIPDPSGPAGNRAAATVHTAEGNISVELTFANNEEPLVKLMDARINKRSLQVVSDRSGQRARLMSGVRRP